MKFDFEKTLKLKGLQKLFQGQPQMSAWIITIGFHGFQVQITRLSNKLVKLVQLINSTYTWLKWVLFQQEQEVLAQNLDLAVRVQGLCPLEVETWARFGLHDHLAEIKKMAFITHFSFHLASQR